MAQNGSELIQSLVASGANGSAVLTNRYHRGFRLVIDVTALAGTTPTITVSIKWRDPDTGKTGVILASAAISATGTTTLTIYPGLVAAANVAANDVVPDQIQVDWTIGGTTPQVTAKLVGKWLV